MFYNAIANNGRMVKPMFVRSINRDGQVVRRFRTETVQNSIAKSSTIRAIHEMLIGVVECELGTANRRRSEAVRFAGKPGTARAWRNTSRRYLENRHRVSFVGYFPADKPLYTAIVVVNEPVNSHAGRASSVVAFANIAERTMALKSVTPRQIASDSIRMSNVAMIPQSSDGNFRALRTVKRNLRIPISGESSDWVRTSIVDDEKQIQPLELADGKIPDVRGMGAKDAVYLLEKIGLNVQINGRGRVVSQSIHPGTQSTSGRKIVLNLR
jgi:cell division protein FtsI (penicillin-binding protein 3)